MARGSSLSSWCCCPCCCLSCLLPFRDLKVSGSQWRNQRQQRSQQRMSARRFYDCAAKHATLFRHTLPHTHTHTYTCMHMRKSTHACSGVGQRACTSCVARQMITSLLMTSCCCCCCSCSCCLTWLLSDTKPNQKLKIRLSSYYPHTMQCVRAGRGNGNLINASHDASASSFGPRNYLGNSIRISRRIR